VKRLLIVVRGPMQPATESQVEELLQDFATTYHKKKPKIVMLTAIMSPIFLLIALRYAVQVREFTKLEPGPRTRAEHARTEQFLLLILTQSDKTVA
jgi:hypothetical protein